MIRDKKCLIPEFRIKIEKIFFHNALFAKKILLPSFEYIDISLDSEINSLMENDYLEVILETVFGDKQVVLNILEEMDDQEYDEC